MNSISKFAGANLKERSQRPLIESQRKSLQGCKVLNLIFIEGNMNSEMYCQMLKQFVLPELKEKYPERTLLLQQDNAPCHVSKLSRKWLEENMPDYLEFWPVQSAPMNQIETMWMAWIKSDLKQYCKEELQNREVLKNTILGLWRTYPQEKIDRLIQKTINIVWPAIRAAGGDNVCE